MSNTKYAIYRDPGNKLMVLDEDYCAHYPVPSVGHVQALLIHRVTTDLNNPPSEANPWLCESMDGTVVLFTSADSNPVWQSATNYTYTTWSQYPWAPYGDVLPAIDVKVGDKWETLNGKVGVIKTLSPSEGHIAFPDVEQRIKLTALKRKAEEVAPDDTVYLRAEFEKRHRGLNLTRGTTTNYADDTVNRRWATWITAIDAARAAAGMVTCTGVVPANTPNGWATVTRYCGYQEGGVQSCSDKDTQ